MRTSLAIVPGTGAVLLLAVGLAAAGEPSGVEALRARVEAIQSGTEIAVRGAASARTLEELNLPVERRIDQLRVNLERGRAAIAGAGR
jgi:murein L,D-transpeptidase YcbB/YkuD